MKESILYEKSKAFALRIVKCYKWLCDEQKEYVISKQLLRSGTSIGANVAESIHAESKLDFAHKLAIAQKECHETLYWLELLFKSEYLEQREYNSIYKDADELMRLITASIKTTRRSTSKNSPLTTHHSSLITNH
ncbi:MAG: four helix bundle protein [Bacteroidales bacterium]|nr:four helix bundle protein [Bacteroidales bacterium]